MLPPHAEFNNGYNLLNVIYQADATFIRAILASLLWSVFLELSKQHSLSNFHTAIFCSFWAGWTLHLFLFSHLQSLPAGKDLLFTVITRLSHFVEIL